MENIDCKDCRYYLPVDVFKGICKIGKQQISRDDAGCEKAERQARCKFCENYTHEREYLGKCMGTTLAYPDLIADKCTDFKWLNRN
jgi:hypothetical protein